MIQKPVSLLKRPFRVLLSMALMGGICGAPLMAADSSKKSSDRSSRSKSSDRGSSQRSSSRPSRPASSSRPKSSKSNSSRPQSTPFRSIQSKSKSKPASQRQTRPANKGFKNISGNVAPKTIDRGSSKVQKNFKVTPKNTRPDFRKPQFGKLNGISLGTKELKPRVPDRKAPELKTPDRKIPNRKIPELRIPDRKVPDSKGSGGKFVPKPGKNMIQPKPGRGNNVIKPGTGNFVPKPGKQTTPGKGLSRDDLKGNHGLKPGAKGHNPGRFDFSKHNDFSKGKGKQFDPSKKWLGKNGVPLNKDLFKDKNIKPIRPSLDKQLQAGKLNTLIYNKNHKNWNMKKQFELHKKGDVARQMHFNQNLHKNGGWRNRNLFGKMANSFTKTHFGAWYAGPGMYPNYCWSPHWSAWVDWCWWDWCHPICDPRPIICRPIICDPCVPWVWYDCPVWQPLPIVACGTWVDVDPVIINSGLDLQMLAVRFVDSGHAEQELGPRFRVWFRNNSNVDINVPFNVLLMASNSREQAGGVPEAGSRVDNIAAGQVQSVDIRLPFAASLLSTDVEGNQIPFEQLHVLIDSHREIPEAFEENNGAVIARVDVLPVDPALFSADNDVVMSGAMVNLAGEGFGPEPGKVLMSLNGMNFETEIYGWYDLGVQVKMPELPLVDVAEATFVVVRGDSAVSNPIDVQFAPQLAAVVVE